MKNFLEDLLSVVESAATVSAQTLLTAYVNKATGVPGTPALTAGNIGSLIGVIAAATALQHINAAQTAASTPAVQTINSTVPISTVPATVAPAA